MQNGVEATASSAVDVVRVGRIRTRKSGRRPGDQRTVRSCELRTAVTLADAQDLADIAAQWGVTESTACWGILRDALAAARKESHGLGKAGIAIAAALCVLRREAELESWREGVAQAAERGNRGEPFGVAEDQEAPAP